MKTTLKLEDLTKIADGLKRHGGKIKVIEQIRNWRAKNLDTQALQNLAAPDATEFGMGTFGHELDMEKHIQLVMAARDESICTICTGLLNVPTLGEVSPKSYNS